METRRPMVRRLHLAIGGMLSGIFLVLSAVTLVPHVYGWQFLTVLTPSMTPVLDVGGVIAAQPTAPAAVKEGDVILYEAPGREGILVTHRVVRVLDESDGPSFRTKGDANSVADPYIVPAGNLVGKVRFHVPFAGYLLAYVRTPLGLFTALVLPGLALMSLELLSTMRAARGTRAEERVEVA